MSNIADFRSQLVELSARAARRPEDFGEGVRLLFSCGSRNLPSALAQAEACGVEARGVGRRHILVEVQNRAPTAEWLAGEGAAIAGYFESIGGVNPQIGIDRGPVDIDD
ncbi:MAG: hypothetical protein IE934_06665 [Sphingopyxis sp.]|nr:hypothetical protein [Sphingopyxis sp.]